MAKDYEVKVVESWKPLSAREKIALKNFNDAIQLDEASKEDNLIIKVQNYAVCEVHNEKSDNKDYKKIVVMAESGERYVTDIELKIFAEVMGITADELLR